jgi:hypothetical protein
VAFQRFRDAVKTLLAAPHAEIKRGIGSPFGSLKASNSADVSGRVSFLLRLILTKFQSIEVAIKSSRTFVI